MGKFQKMAKKYSPGQRVKIAAMGESTYDQLHPLGSQAEAAYDAKKAAQKAATMAENEPVIPLPDEEELARIRRRRNARRGGGRASTVLTDEDRLGP